MEASWYMNSASPESNDETLNLNKYGRCFHELNDAVRRYADGRPYEPVGGVQAEHERHDVAYSLRITEKPDLEIAAIVGDIAHNARSALDHIAVALAPQQSRRYAAFPIVVTEDIWLKDGRRPQSRS